MGDDLFDQPYARRQPLLAFNGCCTFIIWLLEMKLRHSRSPCYEAYSAFWGSRPYHRLLLLLPSHIVSESDVYAVS